MNRDTNQMEEMKKRSRGRRADRTTKPSVDAVTKKPNKLRRIIIMSILEVFVLAGIFAYAYVAKQYNKIQRPDFEVANVNNDDLSVENIKKMEGYWNIAVFGVDSRNSSVGKGNNSDVIMIVSINKGTGDIKIVSVFRDTYLDTGNGSYNKINSAYANGGPEQAVKALNKNLDLNITDYVTFNWKAVASGINILGGVDMEITKAEFHYINSYITETVKGTGIGSYQLKSAGMNHLDGVQAVAYARLRYMDNDFARTERQRKVLQLVFDKAKKADVNTMKAVLGDALSMVATNLTWQDGLDAIASINHYNIADTGGFPWARGDANMGKKGACVIPQTLESNVKQLHEFLFGDEDYAVSETVKKISANISYETGMYNEGKYIDHVSTDSGYIPKATSSDNNNDDEDNEESTTSKRSVMTITDAYGNSEALEYETDKNGNVVKIYQTNADGDVIGEYETSKDANGNSFIHAIDPEETDEFGDPIEETSATRATDEDGNTLPAETVKGGEGGPSSTTGSGKPTSATTQTTAVEGGPGIDGQTTTAAAKPGTTGTTAAQPTTAADKPTSATTPQTAPQTSPTTGSGSSSGGPGSGNNETVAAKPQ